MMGATAHPKETPHTFVLMMAPLVSFLFLAALAAVLLLAFRDSRAIADLEARRRAHVQPIMASARCPTSTKRVVAWLNNVSSRTSSSSNLDYTAIPN